MKDLKNYTGYNYRMVLYYDQEEKVYFVEFPELTGCMAEGLTPEKAVKNALKVKDEWIKAALEAGWDIPKPVAQTEVSGRTTLRLPKHMHQKLLATAQSEGVSLNQLVLTYIAAGLERTSAKDYLEKIIEKQNTAINRLKNVVEVSAFQPANIYGQWPASSGWPAGVSEQMSEKVPVTRTTLKDLLSKGHIIHGGAK